ncbi:MAG: alpha/beta fold hydrolase [Dehalococcoidia bacterium]|tara:strand:+ start:193 stop:984 length:792 start_codon:yes stop_codon:yes gene_type:complete
MFVKRNLTDFVETRNGNMYFEKSGSGFPVVLLHPLGMSTWVWENIVEEVSNSYTTYAFDMLGHGKSDKPNINFSIPDYAEALDDACQILNIHRAHYVGNSVGACLAIDMAARYPDRIDKLVLIGCPVYNPNEASSRIEASKKDFDENGLPLTRTLEDLKERTTFANPTQELLELVNYSRNQAGTWVQHLSNSLNNYDLLARLPLIKASKTLVLYGAKDRLKSGAPVLENNILRSSTMILESVAHVPQVESPSLFTNTLINFLS